MIAFPDLWQIVCRMYVSMPLSKLSLYAYLMCNS